MTRTMIIIVATIVATHGKLPDKIKELELLMNKLGKKKPQGRDSFIKNVSLFAVREANVGRDTWDKERAELLLEKHLHDARRESWLLVLHTKSGGSGGMGIGHLS